MRALKVYAGPLAMKRLALHGLQANDITTIPAAAGGPKGLILGALDRFIFGTWLGSTNHEIHLVGASIGAWRMATACLQDPRAALQKLEHDYIHQHFEMGPGHKLPSAASVSTGFAQGLQTFYQGRVSELLTHPRYRLHIVTSRGRHLLGTEHRLRTPLGYLGAYLTNAVHRKSMGTWLERVVFSSADLAPTGAAMAALPFATDDYRTRQLLLSESNFFAALQASCSIPFLLQAVHSIPGAPPGAYWDGGITDYHLHLNYAARQIQADGIVLYPHFQKSVVPGWLDKSWPWRHRATHYLDNMVLLAPDPLWIQTLPNRKLPDRSDFTRYGNDLNARVSVWNKAVSASTQLVEEFAAWLEKPDMSRVEPL